MKQQEFDKLFFEAIKNKDVSLVKKCIEYGADVNARDCDDETPLHIAVRSCTKADRTNKADALDILKNLLEAGADVNARGLCEQTPLHIAARRSGAPVIRMLIEHGADVNARDKDGETPLYHAIWWKSLKAARILLELGADVNVRSEKNGDTPLHYAAYLRRSPEILQALIDAGADVNAENNYGGTPPEASLRFPVENREDDKEIIDILKTLITAGAKCSSNWDLLYSSALFQHRLEITRFLITAGADVNIRNKNGTTLLHCAVRESKPDTARLLIDAGADVNATDEHSDTPLLIAKRKASNLKDTPWEQQAVEIVRMLTDAGADKHIETAEEEPER